MSVVLPSLPIRRIVLFATFPAVPANLSAPIHFFRALCLQATLAPSQRTRRLGLIRLPLALAFGALLLVPGWLAANAAKGSATVALAVASGGKTVTTVISGSLVTLTATTSANSAPVTPGVISFCDTTVDNCSNAGVLGTAQLTSAGTAVLRVFPAVGTHHYKALFGGNTADASGTSSAETLTVTGATTTTLTSSGSAGSYSLTGTVTAANATVSPTNAISFADTGNSYTLGSGTLGAGTTTLSLGSYGTTPSTVYQPIFIVQGDFNGDGKIDLAVGNDPYPGGPEPANGLSIFLGNGDGTFTAGPTSSVANLGIKFLATGDFNNDGKLDLALVDDSNTLHIFTGNGDGSFTEAAAPPSIPVGACCAAVGDFNGDGNLDLAVANDQNTVTILLGNGNATFTAASSSPQIGAPLYIVAGDFNGDGKTDLAVANGQNTVTILLGNGDGTFTEGTPLQPTGSFNSAPGNIIAEGDFNGDGKTDLAVETLQTGPPNISGGLNIVLLTVNPFTGNGDGTFTTQLVFTVQGATNAYSIAAADFNGDGNTDILTFDDAEAGVFLSNGDGTFTASATAYGSTSSPNYDSLAIADLNGDGIPDVAIADSDVTSVHILPVHDSVTASATASGISIPGTGTQNVTATYAGDTNFLTSTSTVVQLLATKITTGLALNASATTVYYGQQITLTAILQPYSIQSLTTNGETVTFASGSTTLGTGTLSSGVATLNVTSLAVGTDSVTASYPGDTNFAPATATAVSIAVGAAAPFVTLAPGSLTFAAQTTGSTSTAQTVTLTNSGTAALSITSIAASGDFAETNNCGTNVAASSTCTISVTFTPTAGGTRTGTLAITDNAGGSPQTVALTGTGSTLTVSSSSTSLTVSSAGGSATAAIQLAAAGGFSGTVNLACTVVYQGTGSATDTPTCSLNPAQQQVSGTGSASTTLTVNTSAPSSASVHNPFLPLGGGALAALLLFISIPRRRWYGWRLLAVLSVVITGSCLGCGGGGSNGNPGTTAGSYNVTVTATSGTVKTSLTIPLTVQ